MFSRAEVVEAEERVVLGSLVTRTRLGDRKEAEEGTRGKGLPEGEGRIANQLASCLSG